MRSEAAVYSGGAVLDTFVYFARWWQDEQTVAGRLTLNMINKTNYFEEWRMKGGGLIRWQQG